MKNYKKKLLILFMIGIVFTNCASGQKNINKDESIKAKETALLLIEFQNEWLKEGHELNKSIRLYLSKYDTISKADKLRSYLNKKGVLVVHIPLFFNEGYNEIPNPRGLQKNIIKHKLFLKGSDSAKIYKKFQPLKNEVVATGRTGLSAFTGSNLQEILKKIILKILF